MSIDTVDAYSAFDITDDFRWEVCQYCKGAFRLSADVYERPVSVGECYVHERCLDSYRARVHWNHWSPHHQAMLKQNRAPWVVGPAIREFKPSWWWEFKNGLAQRLWNWLRGVA